MITGEIERVLLARMLADPTVLDGFDRVWFSPEAAFLADVITVDREDTAHDFTGTVNHLLNLAYFAGRVDPAFCDRVERLAGLIASTSAMEIRAAPDTLILVQLLVPRELAA
jgi:hypothetical protein